MPRLNFFDPGIREIVCPVRRAGIALNYIILNNIDSKSPMCHKKQREQKKSLS